MDLSGFLTLEWGLSPLTPAGYDSRMKIALAIVLTLSLTSVGFLAMLRASKCDKERAEASGASVTVALEQLEARLSTFEARLTELSHRTVQLETVQLEKSRGDNPASTQGTASGAKLEGESADAAIALSSASQVKDAKPAQGKLEKWLESQGMRDEMETLVAKVYESSRTARKQKEQEEADARQKEMQELSEGPYGKYNFRVSSLGKKLDLTTAQKNAMASLFAGHDDRRKELMSQLSQGDGTKPTPEIVQQRVSLWKDLNQQLENQVLLQLNRKQQETFQELPAEDRGVRDNTVEMFANGLGGARVVMREMADKLGVPVVIDAEAPAKPQPKPVPGE